ncbi:MAG: phosphoribosyltransferase [Candidatus Melainabacteria bacterium]|nr:MAG: phosphoribosyltransferase [Candidatus Melainabacteria bacterium]
MFRNRQHAGFLLARHVWQAISQDTRFNPRQLIVVGLPRGGVSVAFEVARMLGSHLDLIASKKIGAPEQPELAVGAVTSDGVVTINDELVRLLCIDEAYIASQRQYLIDKTRAQEEYWLKSAGVSDRPTMQDKQVIIVDDGIATGMTVLAAIESARHRGAHEVIIATPVMSHGAYMLLKKSCDQIIALHILFDFAAIGQFYLDFDQVEDEGVIKAIKQAKEEELKAHDVAVT